MTIVDAIGRPCPVPIIEAKKAIAQLPPEGGRVAVQVNDPTSQSNLERFGQQEGYEVTSRTLENGIYEVEFRVTQRKEAGAHGEGGLVVAIGGTTMGQGDDTLGTALMKSFLFSLTELNIPPKALLFFNSGVEFTTTGSPALKDLGILKEKGTQIVSCGTCLDFFERSQQVEIGEVGNMYQIAATMADATKIINL